MNEIKGSDCVLELIKLVSSVSRAANKRGAVDRWDRKLFRCLLSLQHETSTSSHQVKCLHILFLIVVHFKILTLTFKTASKGTDPASNSRDFISLHSELWILKFHFPGQWRSVPQSAEEEEEEEEEEEDDQSGWVTLQLRSDQQKLWTCWVLWSSVPSGSCSQFWSPAEKTPPVQVGPQVLNL